MKKVAVLQSNYLPWKGVFDLINWVDLFVFLEDVQYTEQDWRNRNIYKTQKGDKWITVPVKNSSRNRQFIYQVEIDNRSNWQQKHYNTFQMNYGKTPYFKQYKWIIEDIYMEHKWTSLSELNMYSTKLIARELGIKTKFITSTCLNAEGTKDDRLIDICKKLKVNYYISGPAAKNYIKPTKFKKENIILDYIRYEYPKYQQMNEPFNHYVTILDLIFNCGPDAPYYIWGWKQNKGEIIYDTL